MDSVQLWPWRWPIYPGAFICLTLLIMGGSLLLIELQGLLTFRIAPGVILSSTYAGLLALLIASPAMSFQLLLHLNDGLKELTVLVIQIVRRQEISDTKRASLEYLLGTNRITQDQTRTYELAWESARNEKAVEFI